MRIPIIVRLRTEKSQKVEFLHEKYTHLKVGNRSKNIPYGVFLWIRIGFNADPNPAFLVNADPDPAFLVNADMDMDPRL